MLSFVERIRNFEWFGDGKSGRMQQEQVVKRVKRVLRRMVEIIGTGVAPHGVPKTARVVW